MTPEDFGIEHMGHMDYLHGKEQHEQSAKYLLFLCNFAAT